MPGYSVHAVDGGAAAISLMRAGGDPFDLLLTDIVMPEMTGAELYEQLTREGFAIPVLYMSGYTDAALSQRSLSASDVQLLRKLFSGDELSAAIGEVIQKSRERG